MALLAVVQIPVASSLSTNAIQSTAYITTTDGLGNWYSGTGFFMSADAVVVTNAHVIIDTATGEPYPYIYICVIDDEYSAPECLFYAYVLAYDTSYDLALLFPWYYIDEEWLPTGEELTPDYFLEELYVPYVDFADSAPALGDDVSILGFPAAAGLASVVLTEGVVSAFTLLFEDVVWYFTTDATINPGNSGGPVFNENEGVVGVASAYSTNELGGSYGYVVSSDTILYWFLTLVDQEILLEEFVTTAFSNDYVEDFEDYEIYDPEEIEIFDDVSFDDPNAEAISYLQSVGIVSGYPDGTFKPDNELNRAELMKILVEGAGYDPPDELYNNCFPDVADDWYARYVCFATDEGWVEGYPDGTFKPEQSVNKVEALKMLLNTFDVGTEETSTRPFSDVSITAWYAEYVNTALVLGLLEETGDYYFPAAYITRGQISENLYRLLLYYIYYYAD